MNNQYNNSTIHFIASKYFPEKSKEEIDLIKNIIYLLKIRNAVIVAHYYTDPEIQKLAEITGGIVSDSLEMAKFCTTHPAKVLLIAGVRFMGETAKIFNPEKTVLMPTLKAECSLDISCPIDKFEKFCSSHPKRTVVVYANTSASIKAHADWVVTSSIAVDLIKYLSQKGKKILWAPDRYLGNYIKKMTNANILSWKGSCIVHEEFKLRGLKKMKEIYPNAAILVHPESPESIINLADVVGSTSQLIEAAKFLPQKQIIVATDRGIFFKMQKVCPEKTFFSAPTEGEGATCKSCARCPWMKMNSLENILQGLKYGGKKHEIIIEEFIRKKALKPLKKMLFFAKKIRK